MNLSGIFHKDVKVSRIHASVTAARHTVLLKCGNNRDKWLHVGCISQWLMDQTCSWYFDVYIKVKLTVYSVYKVNGNIINHPDKISFNWIK